MCALVSSLCTKTGRSATCASTLSTWRSTKKFCRSLFRGTVDLACLPSACVLYKMDLFCVCVVFCQLDNWNFLAFLRMSQQSCDECENVIFVIRCNIVQRHVWVALVEHLSFLYLFLLGLLVLFTATPKRLHFFLY